MENRSNFNFLAKQKLKNYFPPEENEHEKPR